MIKIKTEWVENLSNDAILELLGQGKRLGSKRLKKKAKQELLDSGFAIVELNGIKYWEHKDIIEKEENIQIERALSYKDLKIIIDRNRDDKVIFEGCESEIVLENPILPMDFFLITSRYRSLIKIGDGVSKYNDLPYISCYDMLTKEGNNDI